MGGIHFNHLWLRPTDSALAEFIDSRTGAFNLNCFLILGWNATDPHTGAGWLPGHTGSRAGPESPGTGPLSALGNFCGTPGTIVHLQPDLRTPL